MKIIVMCAVKPLEQQVKLEEQHGTSGCCSKSHQFIHYITFIFSYFLFVLAFCPKGCTSSLLGKQLSLKHEYKRSLDVWFGRVIHWELSRDLAAHGDPSICTCQFLSRLAHGEEKYVVFFFSFYRSFNKITRSGVFLVTFVLVRGGEKYLIDGLRNILLSFVLE